MMPRLALFVLASATFAYVSRRSLTSWRSHGFYRFFAWECIAAMCCLNFATFGQWFGDPLSARQLISWALLTGSIVPAVAGVHQLHRRGRTGAAIRDDAGTLLQFEQTTNLVTTGVFRYVRHPLYSSLLLLAWGVFFKGLSGISAALALGATCFLVLTAKFEELENQRYFGLAYVKYMRDTTMFIPWLF